MDRSQLFLLASLHQDNVRQQNESTLVAGLLAQGYDLPTAHRLVREYMQANAATGDDFAMRVFVGILLFMAFIFFIVAPIVMKIEG